MLLFGRRGVILTQNLHFHSIQPFNHQCLVVDNNNLVYHSVDLVIACGDSPRGWQVSIQRFAPSKYGHQFVDYIYIVSLCLCVCGSSLVAILSLSFIHSFTQSLSFCLPPFFGYNSVCCLLYPVHLPVLWRLPNQLIIMLMLPNAT